jgi:hypothetical protein
MSEFLQEILHLKVTILTGLTRSGMVGLYLLLPIWITWLMAPSILDFYKEDEKLVKNGTKEGGRIAITYG